MRAQLSTCAIPCVALIVACSSDDNPTGPDNGADPDTYAITMTVPAYDRESRLQQVVLEVLTKAGSPAAGDSVTYRQLDHDFLFGMAPGGFRHEWQSQLLDMGFNATWGFPIGDVRDFGVRYFVLNDFGINPWDLEGRDLETEVKPEYGPRFSGLADLTEYYFQIPGAPLAWIDSDPALLEQNWELLGWEFDQIALAAPGAKAFVSITGAANPSDTSEEFLDAMFAAGIDPRIIGVEYHPGFDGSSTEIADMEAYFEGLKRFGRDLYIWETFAISQGSETYPDPGWYNETWQAEAMSGILRVAFENPYIIGVHYNYFYDVVTETEGEQTFQGFVNLDGTPKPSYTATRDYWRSTLVAGEGQTDAAGQLRIAAYPGVYEVEIDDETYEVSFARQSVSP